MLSVYVPVYNEEKIITKNLKRIVEVINQLSQDYQVVVVDDNSKDKSPRLVEEMHKSNPRVKLLRYNFGPSRREAVFLALRESRADIVALVDADLPADPKQLIPMVNKIREGADLCVASRWIRGAKVKREIARWIISGLFNVSVRFFFASKIRDHACGLKVFRREALQRILAKMSQSKYRGIVWDVEVLVRAQKLGYHIAETPVSWVARSGSKVNVGTLISSRDPLSIVYLLKLWLDVFVFRRESKGHLSVISHEPLALLQTV